jgi:ABC-type lipoprotein export system ATPase subunit
VLLELHAREGPVLVVVTHSEALAEHFADRRRLATGRLEAF